MKLLAVIALSSIYSEIGYESNWDCNPGIPHFQNNYHNETRELIKPVVRAKVWKIHRDDGLFEMPANAIESGFEKLIDVFKQYGILVSLYETENIYSDSLYYFAEYGRPFELMQSYSVDEYMNFYYLPNIDYTDGNLTGYGQAFNTPGNELFVAGNECKYVNGVQTCYDLANTFIPIHELGHCLGLFHPHRSYGEEHVIRENDFDEYCEVNCNDSGDFLCDTEASNSLKDDVLFNGFECAYDLIEFDACGYTYVPQIDNFMSYTHFECASTFTPQQTIKMFNVIKNDSTVQQTIVFPGDLNDDLIINVLDALALVNIIILDDDISDFNLWIGDLNNDLTLNVIDIIELINIILL